MSIWEELFYKKDDPNSLDLEKILSLGSAAEPIISSLLGKDNNSKPSSYQGQVPRYKINRQQINPANESRERPGEDRRPGEYGRRYFTDSTYEKIDLPEITPLAEGGLASLKEGQYLKGETDGMADEVPATIDGKEPALLSDGEFVIPADVVSHLGNGNSEAGAKVLYSMMERIRDARTGSKKQGKKINPNDMIPE